MAHALVEEASRRAVGQQISLRDVLAKDAKVSKLLSPADLDRLLDPANYLGMSEQFVERVLASRPGRSKRI